MLGSRSEPVNRAAEAFFEAYQRLVPEHLASQRDVIE
jgi:hypothetical protein